MTNKWFQFETYFSEVICSEIAIDKSKNED